MSHYGSLNSSKHKISNTHNNGANFLQKRLNQLPNLFSNNIERDDDELTNLTKKDRFRLRNFLSVSTHTHELTGEEYTQKKLPHQNYSLNQEILIDEQPKKNSKSNIKECINQKNVRRKSSTINASCVNFSNRNSNSGLDGNLLQKAARRGSIHFYDNDKKKNSSSDQDDFRQKLLRLQRQQLEFIKLNQQLSSSISYGTSRRKRAFIFTDDLGDFEDTPVRLSHAISSLSLIVNDEDNTNCEKLNQNKVSLTNSLTDVNEELINEKNNEIGRVTKWATGFEKLLEDPLGLQIFTEFLKKEFSNENIDFWVKCENFKKLTDVDEMKKESSNIWTTYLDTSSMCQINVDNKARSSCQDALQNPNNTMFELAQTQIFTLMKYDSYSRFLKSQMYKDCIVNEMEGKPIISSSSTNSRSNSNKKPQTETSSCVNSQSNNINNNISNSVNSVSVNLNDNQTSSIPNASSNIAAAVAVVASTGTALITNVTVSNSTQVNDSLTGSNLNLASNQMQNVNSKEKKRMTIIPWTKAFIKWKRLSGEPPNVEGKEKKPPQVWDGQTVNPGQSQTPTLTSGVGATVSKGLNHKTPLVLSSTPDTTNGLTQINSDLSLNLNLLEGKYCRVLCSSDGSSTMIQPIQGQTVYQALNKIFAKKNIPWYKSDLYFVGDYTPIDQQTDAQILFNKEISLVERSLFVLSLIPIAINLCVKANMKRSISSILQPILDFYQIKTTNCGLYLNSGNCILNLNDLCSTLDGQHVLVIHKQQTNFFSQNEIDKLIKVSISDFLPSNLSDYQLEFDDMGILKQFKKNNSVSPLISPSIPSQAPITGNSLTVNNISCQHPKLLKTVNEDQAAKGRLKSKSEKQQNKSVDKLHNINFIRRLVETTSKKCSYTISQPMTPIVIVYDNQN